MIVIDPSLIAPPEPQSVTPRQLRIWLSRRGIDARQVEELLAKLPDDQTRKEALIEWEYALSYEPGHLLLLALGAALGMTADEIAQGMREASEI